MRLRHRHEIGSVEELADHDLVLDRPAPRFAERAGAHRLLFFGEPHRGYLRGTSTKPCGPKGGAYSTRHSSASSPAVTTSCASPFGMRMSVPGPQRRGGSWPSATSASPFRM